MCIRDRGYVRDGYRDEVLGCLGQRAGGEDGLAEALESVMDAGRQFLATLGLFGGGGVVQGLAHQFLLCRGQAPFGGNCRGLRRGQSAYPHPPDLWSLFEVVPGELAGVLRRELVVQRLGVVVVDKHEGRAGFQRCEGVEDQLVADAGDLGTDIDDAVGGGHGGSSRWGKGVASGLDSRSATWCMVPSSRWAWTGWVWRSRVHPSAASRPASSGCPAWASWRQTRARTRVRPPMVSWPRVSVGTGDRDPPLERSSFEIAP